MTYRAFPYEYEIEERKSGLTALGGLPIYLELTAATGLLKAIDNHMRIRTGDQGWSDRQIILALLLLNLVGGDSVNDIERLEGDEGFCRILRKAEQQGLTRKERREIQRRWRKGRTRALPSASVLFRYLENFHSPEQEQLREKGKAFIPAANEHLKALVRVNKALIGFETVEKTEGTATLDMDATLAETSKRQALYSYKGEQAYQPLNTYWYERGVILHTEFRAGNVPAGHEQFRVLEEALTCLPEEVTKVRLRSDTAGYQHILLEY